LLWIAESVLSVISIRTLRVRTDHPVRGAGNGRISFVRVETEILAEIRSGERISVFVANDSGRSSFTAVCGDNQDRLVALDLNLRELASWPAGHGLAVRDGYGWHATSPGRGLALISAPDCVLLLDRAGKVAWRHEHTPWPGGCSGCAWFDEAGDPHAVVPDAADGCALRRLDLESGELLAALPLMAVPAGIHPVHQPGGWVGLSEAEGQDAARAWWVRAADRAGGGSELRVIDAGWDDWILSDADPSGSRIITTSHDGARLLVRPFPGDLRGRTAEEMRLVRHPPEFAVLQEIHSPGDDYFWHEVACFAGDFIVAKLDGLAERFVAVDRDSVIHRLDDPQDGWLSGGPDDTWFAATSTGLRRYRLHAS
jgi:hypothetical protein